MSALQCDGCGDELPDPNTYPHLTTVQADGTTLRACSPECADAVDKAEGVPLCTPENLCTDCRTVKAAREGMTE